MQLGAHWCHSKPAHGSPLPQESPSPPVGLGMTLPPGSYGSKGRPEERHCGWGGGTTFSESCLSGTGGRRGRGQGGEARGRGVLTLEGAEHGQWGGGRAGMGVCRVFPSPDPAHACPASPGAWHPHLPFLGVLGAPSQGRCDLLSVLLPGTHSPVRPQPERPRWGAGSRESDAAGFSLTCS